jgi:hypothetical protein
MLCAGMYVEEHLADGVLVEVAHYGCRHMLDLAATYQRVADQMVPKLNSPVINKI